jgi:cation-transporting ATPase I
MDVRRRVASSRPHERLTPRANRVGDHLHVDLRRVWPDQAGRFVAALTDGLSDLPVVWIDVRLLDGLLVLALDEGAGTADERAVAAVIGAVETAEARAGIECNPFPEHRHGSPVEDEPLLRAAAEVVADVFAFGVSVSLRALRVPRPPLEVDMEGLVALVQNVPGLRRTLARWVGRATAEASAGVAAALAGGVFQNLVGPVVGFAYHSLRLGELRARQEAWLAAEPGLYGPSAEAPVAGASSELADRPLPRPPGPVERIAEMTWLASLGTFVATLPLTGSVENALSVLASGAPKAARLGREAFGSHLSRDLGGRGIVVLRPGSLRLLDQVDVVVVEGRLWNGESEAAVRLQQVAAANEVGIIVVGGGGRRSRATARSETAPSSASPDAAGSVLRVPAAEGPSAVRRLQITGRVVATVGGPSFGPLAAGDLPIGVTGNGGRAPDGSHVICPGGLPDVTRVLAACGPARQASRESANLSLVGAVAGALLAMAPAILPGRRPRVLTAIDTAALAAVANAVRHARQAESSALRPEPPQVSADPASLALQSLRSCVSDEEEALA